VIALQAFDADICSKADNLPVITAAGVHFSQANDIAQGQILEHAGDYIMGGIISSMLGFNLDIPLLISRILILVIAITVHEFAHAWVADYFGDPTPRINGRVTLNPLAHLDPLGSLLILTVGFGWGKPVPINPYNLQRRSPAAGMWVSLAGPLSNFILAILAAIPLRLGLSPDFGYISKILPTPANFLVLFIVINLWLMLFNLIPIAPLDGEAVAGFFWPPSWARVLQQISRYGPIIFVLIAWILPMFGFSPLSWLISPVETNLFNLLLGNTTLYSFLLP
jgi:Zn-dependent protease